MPKVPQLEMAKAGTMPDSLLAASGGVGGDCASTSSFMYEAKKYKKTKMYFEAQCAVLALQRVTYRTGD